MTNKPLVKCLLWLWQLPQHIIALILISVLRCVKSTYGETDYVWYAFCKHRNKFTKFISGVSLGEYIILPARTNFVTILHEYGHTMQSRLLGPLYLIVVGIPSVVNNLLSRVNENVSKTYYRRYPENWADTWGGVVRT